MAMALSPPKQSSLDYDVWAWQHSSPTHVTVAMHKYRDESNQQANHSSTWNRIAAGIINNPHVSSVQLDIGTVTDQPFIQSMVNALQSLQSLKTLHVQTLQAQNDQQTLLALEIVVAAAKACPTLCHVNVEGLWLATPSSVQLFRHLLQDTEPNIREWTWSHLQCSSPQVEAMIGEAWSKNTSWTAWKVAGHVPLSWMEVASRTCQTTTKAPKDGAKMRLLGIERVTTQHKGFWRAVQDLIVRSNNSWRLEVRAMHVDGYSWRALSKCTQLMHLSLTHCCIDTSFPVASLSSLVSSMELLWNRLEDEARLVELLNSLYQTPETPRDHCQRQSLVLHHHWCQVFDWDLPSRTLNLATMIGPLVQWNGTRWPSEVLRRLEFYKFLRDCRCSKSCWVDKVRQHSLGSSVLFHALREDPTVLFQNELPTAQTVMAG